MKTYYCEVSYFFEVVAKDENDAAEIALEQFDSDYQNHLPYIVVNGKGMERESFMGDTSVISLSKASDLFRLLSDGEIPGKYIPKEKFVFQEPDARGRKAWVALDNTDGNAYVEEFHSLYDALRWSDTGEHDE